jgi:hypothetical protein
MNISYTNMCKRNQKREWRKEWERERGVGGDGVCGCSFGKPLRQQENFQTSLYIQTVLKNNFVLFIWECRITTGQNFEV